MQEENNVVERPLGEILVDSGYLTQEQLDHALRVQDKLKRRKRIGRILIELGYLSDDEMREILAKNARRVRLGDLLVEREFITPEELDRVLDIQKAHPNVRLGELLIREKLLTEKTFCDALALYLNMDRVVPEFKRLDWQLLDRVSVGFLETNKVLPYDMIGGKLRVLVMDTDTSGALATLANIFGVEVVPALSGQGEIESILQYIRERPTNEQLRPLKERKEDDSVSALLDRFILEAVEMGASDVHIEPMDSLSRVRLRIDGNLVQTNTFTRDQHKPLIARAKIIAGSDIAEQRNHQDGKAQVSFRGHPVDLRFSFYVSVHGESCVIRLLNPMTNLMSLDGLGLTQVNYTRYADEVVQSAGGIVLISGPTGSGKTTTLYSTLQFQQEDGYKIITIEDPVEYMLHGLVQCSVDEKAGRTFGASLRNIMRQDPDVIVLGEMRDKESAEMAMHAALTGHKVYSTFHTEDAVGGLIRLVQMGIEKYLVSGTVLAIVAQRLVRRICSYCRAPYVPNAKHLRRLGVSPEILKRVDFKRGRGCEQCHGTGYSGRVPIHEVLIPEERVRDGILRDVSSYQLRQLAISHADMITMAEDGLYKVFKHQTTFEEIIRHVPITTTPRDISQLTKMVET